MDKNQTETFRKILNDLRDETLTRKDDNIASERLPDLVDAAADDLEKQVSTKFITRKNLFIRKIDLALQKIDNGKYGCCESCGDDINLKRLLARPTASLCLDCKQEQEYAERKEKERQRGGFLEEWE